MKTWKLEEMTREELRQELEARGYSRTPKTASKAQLLEAIEADDRGQVTQRWW